MSASPRRVVITSLGVLSPVGDAKTMWPALIAGKSAVRKLQSFDATPLPTHIAGEFPEPFNAKKYIPASNRDGVKMLRNMAKTVQMGLCAGQMAMDDGGPAKGTIDPFRFGIEIGCVMVASELDDLVGAAKEGITATPRAIDMDRWGKESIEKITPLWMLKYLPNMPACHISVFFDAQGPNNTITGGDAASILALGEAFRLLQRDAADYFLVGGCDSKLNALSFTRNNLFGQFTRKNATPETAVRPFDADRDGTTLGEAAAMLGVEEYEHAKKRGAKIYAELVGFASGFDRGRKGGVLAGVIRNALKEAGITPADVDFVTAHGLGHVAMDAFEARGIAEVFGTGTPVYAMKGQLGNSGAASGAVELAATILCLQHGQLPGTVNHTKTAADCPIRVHVGSPRDVSKPYAVKISYTDLGQCAVAVVKKVV